MAPGGIDCQCFLRSDSARHGFGHHFPGLGCFAAIVAGSWHMYMHSIIWTLHSLQRTHGILTFYYRLDLESAQCRQAPKCHFVVMSPLDVPAREALAGEVFPTSGRTSAQEQSFRRKHGFSCTSAHRYRVIVPMAAHCSWNLVKERVRLLLSLSLSRAC